MNITYGTRGSETQEEAMGRFWAPSIKYATELFKERSQRCKDMDQVELQQQDSSKKNSPPG